MIPDTFVFLKAYPGDGRGQPLILVCEIRRNNMYAGFACLEAWSGN